MSLIDKIDGKLVAALGGTTATGASASSIAGKGVGATFGGDTVDITSAMDRFATAFSNSFTRFDSAAAIVTGGVSILNSLSDKLDDLIAVSHRAADESSSDTERASLDIKFQKLRREVLDIFADADIGTNDLLSISDLSNTLAEAGVDTGGTTNLAQLLAKMEKGDGELGFERIPPADAILRALLLTGSAGKYSGVALTDIDPLDSSITTRADAIITEDVLNLLKDTVKKDLENLTAVQTEVLGVRTFARFGALAADDLISTSGGESADAVAQKLKSTIISRSGDSSIREHSELDRKLVAELLG